MKALVSLRGISMTTYDLTKNNIVDAIMELKRAFGADTDVALLLRYLQRAEILLKKWYHLFPASSTTMTSKRILLAKDWNTWSEYARAGNLLHESVHCRQHDLSNDSASWDVKYLTNSRFRLEAEIEASIWELRYFKKIWLYIDLNYYVKELIDDHLLPNKYFAEAKQRLSAVK